MSDDDSEPPVAIFDQPASAVIDNPKARFQKESTTPTPPHVAYMIVKQKASHQTPQLRPAIIKFTRIHFEDIGSHVAWYPTAFSTAFREPPFASVLDV
jgi:hypothetical protein